MKKHVSKYFILLLLATMFAAPGIAAYIFYQHPTWLSASKVNKGTLLSPPIALNAFDKRSKWRIIYWSPGACETRCLSQLDMLARVRLALGRKLYMVDQWLVLGDRSLPISNDVNALLKERDFHMARLSSDELAKITAVSSDAKIYIANPDNYLVLSYQLQATPEDIYKDLKLLLSTTENKSG
jgi:hypothetical protein